VSLARQRLIRVGRRQQAHLAAALGHRAVHLIHAGRKRQLAHRAADLAPAPAAATVHRQLQNKLHRYIAQACASPSVGRQDYGATVLMFLPIFTTLQSGITALAAAMSLELDMLTDARINI
jgi:hypothetical protein